MRRLISAWCLLMVVFAANSMFGLATSGDELPDAPEPQTTQAGSQPSAGSSSLVGTVEDMHGRPFAGVVVTAAKDNEAAKTATVDEKGAFTIPGLEPGTYTVSITLPGRSPQVATEVTLGAREELELPIVTERNPHSTTTVQVSADLTQVATAQVQLQEKQRILGVVPNFYTTYLWDSAPMTPKLKFKLALRAGIDPIEFVVDAGVAGAEQYHNTFPGYGGGWQGYGKRFGSAYADSAIGAMLGRALFPIWFHQDPRYFYRGTGSVPSRVLYALSQTVVTRGDNGASQPNYSHVLGNFVTAGISNVYRAPGDRTFNLTMRDALVVTAGDAVGNVLREFISRPFTSNVPKFAKGKEDSKDSK
ncbi:MAG TPA: carboxypeptidase-like regulatory domain-containing protein [Acidobacteriaceae bacterium]|nr:carboxypeptidase-like regulatory domain-containing protein [Acidobacteriaceae bacterium]